MSESWFRALGARASRDLAGLNHRPAQVPNTHQVVGGTGEGEYPVVLSRFPLLRPAYSTLKIPR
jgi:hypothetical protein